MCVYVCVCVHVRACVRAYVRACVCVVSKIINSKENKLKEAGRRIRI